MHETSIVTSLIELIRQRLADDGALLRGDRVTRVKMVVGPLAGVETAALRFAFEAVAPGSIVEGAELELVTPKLLAWCRGCEEEREVASVQKLVCPVCGAPAVELLTGRELELESLEVVAEGEVAAEALT